MPPALDGRLDGSGRCVCIGPGMKKLFVLSLLGVALVGAAGCYSTESGRSKFGMPFAKDTIESRYERPVPVVVAAAREVLTFNGTLTADNTVDNSLTAKVNNKTVWVKVDEVETGVSRIRVQARGSAGGADIDLASEIDKQIAIKLTQTR